MNTSKVNVRLGSVINIGFVIKLYIYDKVKDEVNWSKFCVYEYKCMLTDFGHVAITPFRKRQRSGKKRAR